MELEGRTDVGRTDTRRHTQARDVLRQIKTSNTIEVGGWVAEGISVHRANRPYRKVRVISFRHTVVFWETLRSSPNLKRGGMYVCIIRWRGGEFKVDEGLLRAHEGELGGASRSWRARRSSDRETKRR